MLIIPKHVFAALVRDSTKDEEDEVDFSELETYRYGFDPNYYFEHFQCEICLKIGSGTNHANVHHECLVNEVIRITEAHLEKQANGSKA